MPIELNHKEINAIAHKWLLRPVSSNGAGCKIAFTEVGGQFSGERADAWGYHWDSDVTIVVETKVSRADFLADKKKRHRTGEVDGMGLFRYYICPEGLIREDELPEKWGLLYVNKRGHVKLICGHLVGATCYYLSDSQVDQWGHAVNRTHEQRMMGLLLSHIGDAESTKETMRSLKRDKSYLEQQLEKTKQELKKARMQNIGQIAKSLDEIRIESKLKKVNANTVAEG